MRHRLAILTCVLVLLAPAVALAQDGNPFDGSLPPAQPTPAPTVESDNSASQDDIGRTTLYLIAGGVFVALFFVGWWISRDARSNLPEDKRDDKLGPDGKPLHVHKHEQQAKAKARAKGRAQKQARKAHRKKGRSPKAKR
jgi:hypothetical protein